MEWYEKCGWNNNPFEQSSMPDAISGFDDIRKELLGFIKSGDCCLLLGEAGTGKTIILKWLEDCLSSKDAALYLNTSGMSEEEIKKIDIDKIIKEKTNSWNKMFGRKKSFVILIDDAQSLPATIADSVKRNFDNKTISSVVLASRAENLDNLKGILLEKIGDRKVRLRPMTSDEAMGMIINRVKYKNPFEEGSLEIIFEKAKFIPRNILGVCELVARKNNDKIITKEFVEKCFGEKEKPKEPEVKFIDRLSPLQRDIVNILKTGNFTPKEISVKLNKPNKTITSQLAYLGLKTKIEVMRRKGIENPVVEKVSDRPAIYRLTEEAKEA